MTQMKLLMTALKNIEPVIPSKRNRKIQRSHDEFIYWHGHLLENVFLHLKRWRDITARYAKNASSILAAIYVRGLALWTGIS